MICYLIISTFKNEFDTDVYLFDIDPDLQYFNIKNIELDNDKLKKCTYYSEDSFNKKCYPLVKGGNFLSLLHVNARSAPKNLDNYIIFTKYKYIFLSSRCF